MDARPALAKRLLTGVVWLGGALLLLWPWLSTWVTSDSRYHYLLAPGRMHNSLLGVWNFTIGDMTWRLHQGRIAPVGVFWQHVLYYLGMRFSLATGAPLWVSEAVVKVMLLALVVAAFAWLVYELRSPGGEPLPGRGRAVFAFATLMVCGVTTNSPTVNGWTTFVVLCVGGCLLLLLSGALGLWALNHWDAWGVPARVAACLGMVLAGVWIVLSYEMHWAAYPFVVALVLLHRRADWRPRTLLPDRARWWVLGTLSLGFWTALVTTRLLIRRYGLNEYSGLQVDLGPAAARTFVLNLLNAVPGSGIGWAVRHDAPGGASPWPALGPLGWLGGLFLAGAVALWVRRWLGTSGAEGTDESPTRTWLGLAVAAGVSAVAAAAIVSVSPQAQARVSNLGDAYRATPWVWCCLVIILAVVVVTVRRRWPLVLLALAPLVAGVLVWPSNMSSAESLEHDRRYVAYERLESLAISGDDSPAVRTERCQVLDEIEATTKTSYDRSSNEAVLKAYQQLTGRPFCQR